MPCWYRVIARDARREPDVDEPVSLAEVRDVVQRVLGTDLGMGETRWTSRFHSDERQVRRYRVGRALLAGDAAHVHSPAGGMGMNTGLQDAANLSWKLAAVLDGRARDDLLDTHHDERQPIGAQVLRVSGGLIRAALRRDPVTRAMRDVAIRTATSLPRVRAALVGRVSGVGLRYPAPAGSHRAVGSRAHRGGTDLPLSPARFVLAAPQRLLAAHHPAAVVRTVETDPAAPAVLVRPDGYLAWQQDPGGDDAAGLARAAARWGAVAPGERPPGSAPR